MTAQPDPAYTAAVWSWEQHVRSGGRTSWRDWLAEGPHQAQPPAGWLPAGAAQLELVRRATARERSADLGVFTGLVLSRSGPGRGRAQQPLPWPHPGAGRFGAPALDPADVPTRELVRLCVGVLTELVLAGPGAAGGRPRRAATRRGRFSRRPEFRLAGAPVTAAVVRSRLAASGHREGGRAPTVVLLVEPFDAALVQAWSARVQRGAAVRWQGFVDRWAGRRELPPSVDLVATARHWASRVGAERVHVVVPGDATDGRSAATPAQAAADVLGLVLRADESRIGHCGPLPLTPEQVDVCRRVNGLLAVRADDTRREEVRDRLLRLFPASSPSPPSPSSTGLTVSRRLQDWAATRASEQVTALAAGGYAVHGRLEDLVPRFAPGRPTHPRQDRVLDVLLAACVDATVPPRPSQGGSTR